MTVTINDPYGKGRAGAAGPQVGNQIATGLQQLAQHKMNQITQRNQVKAYEDLGLPKDIASSLSKLPPDQQKLVLGNIGENQGFGQQQGQPIAQGGLGQQQGQPRQFSNKEERANYYAGLKETEKENRGYIKDMQESSKENKDNDLRLSRLDKLSKSGKLSNNTWLSILDTLKHGIFGVGIDLTNTAVTPETEEFNKISNEMIKGAKSIFGSRITDQDLKIFLQMIPTAKQSQEGRQRVIHQMKLFSEGQKVRKQALDSILRMNGGIPPHDVREQVEEIAGPALDKIAQQYELGIQDFEIPQGETVFGTKRKKRPIED